LDGKYVIHFFKIPLLLVENQLERSELAKRALFFAIIVVLLKIFNRKFYFLSRKQLWNDKVKISLMSEYQYWTLTFWLGIHRTRTRTRTWTSLSCVHDRLYTSKKCLNNYLNTRCGLTRSMIPEQGSAWDGTERKISYHPISWDSILAKYRL
jgi:hypothetical protein